MIHFLFILVLSPFVLVQTVKANVIFQEKFHYEVRPEIFLKKQINYSLETLTYSKLVKEHTDLAEIVETIFPKIRHLNYVITKSSYLIQKPVGSESQEVFKNIDFVKSYLSAGSITREDHIYRVKSLNSHLSYSHKMYFDSDDLSTLNESRIQRSINLIKKQDVISQGSHLTVIHHQNKFNADIEASLKYQMFIPIKDNLTLILNYGIIGTKLKKIKKENLKKSFEEELVSQQALLNK